MKFKLIATAALAATLATPALAQTVLVATGAENGTYSTMFRQFASVCGNGILKEKNTTGSVQNLDDVANNVVNAAVVQTDSLFFRAQNSTLNVKTLVGWHNETVHVIAPVVSPIKVGGFAGFNAKKLEINSVNDLEGQAVAAWGGSMDTAQIIRLQGEINFTVLQVNNFTEAKAALDSGQVAAIVMVGGQPMKDVAALPRQYKFLTFSEQLVGKLRNVYSPDRLNYSNLGQGGTGVPSVSTKALLVTRPYKSPQAVAALQAIRECFVQNLDMISETTGNHRAWQTVSADDLGKWPVYEFNAAQTPVAKKK